ncbi:MAG: M20/M25/M40 family metallo-hydrolase [Thermoanaerobaculia bacterium]|jgi:Zn-dependent M28 family amino/carboxypeptidase
MRISGILALASVLSAPFGFAADLVTPAEKEAASEITAAGLKADIRFLSSDLLEGRGPASRGDALAEAYIQSQMEAAGLKPGAPGGGWVQEVPLVGILPAYAEPATFASPKGTTTGVLGKDFVAVSGDQKPASRIEDAEIVFVGYGIVAPEYRWDDYKGADLKGKVMLVMNNDPEGTPEEPNLFAGKTRLWYGRWDYKYLMAARMGAAGAIVIHTTPSAGYGWQVIQTSWKGELFELPEDGSAQVRMKMWATDDLAKRIAALGGKDLDRLRASAESRSFRPVPLGVTLSLAFTNAVVRKESGNVIGVLPGSDPERAGEAVIYTAHHDHLGEKTGAKPGDDAIYNGALDNASGVAGVLAVARAFADLPKAPARSVYFAFVAAEEQGLLGSEWLARHPPVRAGRIAANINLDGIGFYGRTRDVGMIGLGKSSLDADFNALAAMQGRTTHGDEFPEKGSFYRSDQFSFARIGVPAAYVKKGTDVIGRPAGWGKAQEEAYEKNDYHQPSDDFRESWDFSGAVEDMRLAFLLGCRVADAPGMPRWNKGDEFEAARLKALAEQK